MAVYSKLLLSAGGGIISLQQQADQERNSASVLIGLGGTGVDCLRTIKTQVYARLKPDDPEAIIPQYQHIRFLGVDADRKSRGVTGSVEEERADALRVLDDTEFFSIANSHVKRDLSNKLALKDREELNWLCHEEIQAGDLTIAGAGGIRQVGRYMLMDKSNLFLSRLEQEINAAKSGLVDPSVNIHIFSGLSGGTGAGTFLDVCYMVRSVAKRLGNITIFGYFFLPDVNLARIPFENTKVRAYIPRNGYASMQELDYCMQLQYNGGHFTQTYQGHHKIEWSEPPVDLCHLVCATNANGDVVENAYDYAMSVTTEYVMDFLTQSEGKSFGLTSQLSNFRSCVGIADGEKHYGTNVSYCVIGASCASMPLREVNTYVASELFERFAQIGSNLPTKGDVEALAVSAFASSQQMGVSQIYDSLFYELNEGVEPSYSRYPDDWKFVHDYGNKELVNHYTNQTASKLNSVEVNAKSMQDPDNKNSLIGRLRQSLADIIRDIGRGPQCAHRMLSASESHNLLNVIDGLIEDNQSRWDQEAYQDDLRMRDYESARRDFDQGSSRGLFAEKKNQERFDTMERSLMYLEQHKLDVACYRRMDEVLRALRDQVEEVDANYYLRLARVTDTLIETFRENRESLGNERIATTNDAFAIPLMTIAELRGPMNAEIEKLNVPGLLDGFMKLLLDNETEWLQEDENKICKLVTKFFVEVAFSDFAGRSITRFLSDKYGTDNDEALTNRIYEDWMVTLTQKARPLFYFNGTIWREDQTSQLAFLSVPATSAPIQHAAEKMRNTESKWEVKRSALTDRIYVMSSAAALPLSAYNYCDEYERGYFSVSSTSGTHYYEGKPIPGLRFDDWRKLPPLTPQALVNLDKVPDPVRVIVQEARDLFEEAMGEGLIGDDWVIRRPAAESLDALRAAADRCTEMAERLNKPDGIPEAKELLSALSEAGQLELGATDAGFHKDGYAERAEIQRRILEDHFVYAPSHRMLVREILDEIASARDYARTAEQELQGRIDAVGAGSRDILEFCDALFTGALSFEGRKVVYPRSDHGIDKSIVLAQRSDEFPYANIPVYQGYLSFKNLDAQDRAAIKDEVNRRYNDDSPEIIETGSALKEDLAKNRISAWVQLAAHYTESAEIIEFIEKMCDQFKTFCLENGI